MTVSIFKFKCIKNEKKKASDSYKPRQLFVPVNVYLFLNDISFYIEIFNILPYKYFKLMMFHDDTLFVNY